MPPKPCADGYRRSTTDKHRRCVPIRNEDTCNSIGKDYNRETNRCRIKCKPNEERSGTRNRCIKSCPPTHERGPTRRCRRIAKVRSTKKKSGKSSRRRTPTPVLSPVLSPAPSPVRSPVLPPVIPAPIPAPVQTRVPIRRGKGGMGIGHNNCDKVADKIQKDLELYKNHPKFPWSMPEKTVLSFMEIEYGGKFGPPSDVILDVYDLDEEEYAELVEYIGDADENALNNLSGDQQTKLKKMRAYLKKQDKYQSELDRIRATGVL